jgi:hypothetical protein
MVKFSEHRQTDAVKKLGQQLGRLGDDFSRLAEQQAEQEMVHRRDDEALSASLRMGLERIHARIAELEEAGGWHKQYFNWFTVADRTYSELTHSKVLAWLLNPMEAHGLGDAFLRAFVKEVFHEDLSDTTSVVVKREYRIVPSGSDFLSCDIVIWLSADCVLVIENKIYSSEGKNQLSEYARYWRKRVQKPYFVYLTRNGERPTKCEHFISVSYHTVRRLLTKLTCDEELEPFIRQFADNIWFVLSGG